MSLEGLYKRRRELLDQKHSFVEALESLRSGLEPAIMKLTQEADELEKVWRPLVIASREAYASGDGEMAKSYSLQYKPYYEECLAKNAEAKSLREEIAALRQVIRDVSAEISELDEAIKDQKAGHRSLAVAIAHGVYVKNFTGRAPSSNREVREFLAELPEDIWRHVESITFLQGDSKGTEPPVWRGWTEWTSSPKGSGAALITVAAHPDNEYALGIAYTIIHESAHVAWERCLTQSEREWWDLAFATMKAESRAFPTKYAGEKVEELFAECFALYASSRTRTNLATNFPAFYNEMHVINERLRQ